MRSSVGVCGVRYVALSSIEALLCRLYASMALLKSRAFWTVLPKLCRSPREPNQGAAETPAKQGSSLRTSILNHLSRLNPVIADHLDTMKLALCMVLALACAAHADTSGRFFEDCLSTTMRLVNRKR